MAGSLASSEWAVASAHPQDKEGATTGGAPRPEKNGNNHEEKSPPAAAAGEAGWEGQEKEEDPVADKSQRQGLHNSATGTTEELDAILANLGPDVPRSPRAEESPGRRRDLRLAASTSTDLDRILDGAASPRESPREDPYRLRHYLAALAPQNASSQDADAEIFVPALPSRVSTRRLDAGGGDVSVSQTEVSGLTEPEAASSEGATGGEGGGAPRDGEGPEGGDDEALARYRREVEFAAFDGGATRVVGETIKERSNTPVLHQGGLMSKLVQLLSTCGCFGLEYGDVPESTGRGEDKSGNKRMSRNDSGVTRSTVGTFADPVS